MDIFSMLLSVAALCSAALFASIMALVPATGLSFAQPSRRYYTIKAPALVVSRVQEEVKEEVEMEYEHSAQRNRMIARFSPFQFATSQEMEIWDAVVEESFEHTSVACEETVNLTVDPRIEILKAAYEYNMLVAKSLALVAEANVLLPKIQGKKPLIKQTKGKKKGNAVHADVFRNVVQTGLGNGYQLYTK